MEENFFYKNKEKGIIREELLTARAKEWAKKFINVNPREDKQLNSAQLRRFYNEVKHLEGRVSIEGFEKMKPLIKMLKSKVSYACPKKVGDRKVPATFKNYINEMVDNVIDEQDFKAFVLSFESVVGFFYGEGGR